LGCRNPITDLLLILGESFLHSVFPVTLVYCRLKKGNRIIEYPLDWNGFSAIYAIIDPSSWKSEYVKLTETSGYWIPDTIRYETLTWANIGKLLDMSIREGGSELMAVSHTPAGWGDSTSQILLFEGVNCTWGNLTPIYDRVSILRPIKHIVLIDPPDPPPQQ
jgi:hypothetical protein